MHRPIVLRHLVLDRPQLSELAHLAVGFCDLPHAAVKQAEMVVNDVIRGVELIGALVVLGGFLRFAMSKNRVPSPRIASGSLGCN